MSTRKEVFDKLNETNKLPSPSDTTLKVIQLCHDDSTSLNDIAEVIQLDPAFSAELLKYANAFFLSTGLQVMSVQKAAVKLGIRTVVKLALSLSLLSSNKKGKCAVFDYERFWSISLLQAIAARNFVGAENEFDPDEIFVCALLAHMGQLALASAFPQEYGDLLSEFSFESYGQCNLTVDENMIDDCPSNLQRKELEKKRFEIDSSELTTELFLNWGLPAQYALAAGFHNDLNSVELGTGTTKKIAQLLNLSHQLAQICLHVPPTRLQLGIVEKNAEKFGIPREQFGEIYDAIIGQWQEWGEVFEIQTSRSQLYNEIMTDQNEEQG